MARVCMGVHRWCHNGGGLREPCAPTPPTRAGGVPIRPHARAVAAASAAPGSLSGAARDWRDECSGEDGSEEDAGYLILTEEEVGGQRHALAHVHLQTCLAGTRVHAHTHTHRLRNASRRPRP